MNAYLAKTVVDICEEIIDASKLERCYMLVSKVEIVYD